MNKERWYLLILSLSFLMGFAVCQDSWELGSPSDWLSVGPVKHVDPYYFPNSDLPTGIQRFLADYPGYTPIYYPSYYPTYSIYYRPVYYSNYDPYYYPYSRYYDIYPLGTFGIKRGGNLW
jgi:hypothetical protein